MAELVGLNAQVPDILPKLSQLLQIQHQQTQLGMERQTARQREALAQYDWNKHIGPDGTLDLNTLNDPQLMAAAGDQYQDVLQRAIAAKTSQLETKRTLTALRNDQREAFGEMMNALRSDRDVAEDTEKGRQKVNEAMIQYGEMYGEDVLQVLSAYAGALQKAPKGRMADALRAIGLQAMDASQQVSAQQPQYAPTGGELTQINPLTPAGSAPGSIPLTIPPGAPIVTDAYGRMFRVDPQTNQATPVGVPVDAPPAGSAPAFPYPGQQQDIQTHQQDVQSVRATADQAPLNRSIYEHILKLSDDTGSGPAIAFLQRNPIIGQMFGDNYQEMGKYLEKNAIANMQAMGGPPSDARLSAAVAANGSTQFNPQALKAVTKFNYATNTALEQFREGIDKAVGTKDPDYAALPEFRSNWARNFDVDIFRIENAQRMDDKAELDKIRKEISPARARELKEKAANLRALSETGQLP